MNKNLKIISFKLDNHCKKHLFKTKKNFSKYLQPLSVVASTIIIFSLSVKEVHAIEVPLIESENEDSNSPKQTITTKKKRTWKKIKSWVKKKTTRREVPIKELEDDVIYGGARWHNNPNNPVFGDTVEPYVRKELNFKLYRNTDTRPVESAGCVRTETITLLLIVTGVVVGIFAFVVLQTLPPIPTITPPNSKGLIAHYPPYEELKNLNMSILQNFHNYTITLICVIIFLIITIIFKKITCKFTNLKLLARRALELIWTFLPILVLIIIAIPSLKFLYLIDIRSAPAITLKVFGAQWYWIYQYGDFINLTLNSYILKDFEIIQHQTNFMCGWRLLETDVRGILPFLTEIRLLITAQDVIHSFSMPGLGIKVDAVPGRLNWTSLFNYVPGLVYGQCSEICGVGHSFIPIIIEFTRLKDFLNKVNSI